MCTVWLPPVINPTTVNKCTITSYGGEKRVRRLGGSTSLGVALALAVLEVVTMEVSGKGGGEEDDGGTWRRLNVIFKDMTASLSY